MLFKNFSNGETGIWKKKGNIILRLRLEWEGCENRGFSNLKWAFMSPSSAEAKYISAATAFQ